MSAAVPGCGCEAGVSLGPDEDAETVPAERPGDGERGALVAVCDECREAVVASHGVFGVAASGPLRDSLRKRGNNDVTDPPPLGHAGRSGRSPRESDL